MNGLYFKRHLQDALRKAALPWSYNSILKFERLGIIPKPKRIGGRERFYTLEEIQEVIRKVRAHQKSHLPKD